MSHYIVRLFVYAIIAIYTIVPLVWLIGYSYWWCLHHHHTDGETFCWDCGKPATHERLEGITVNGDVVVSLVCRKHKENHDHH